MTYAEAIDTCASAAARETRAAYNAAGHAGSLDYDLARLAAQDRGLSLADTGDVEPEPITVDDVCAAIDRLTESLQRRLASMARERAAIRPGRRALR